jgi:hypothetical protein
MDGRSRSCPSRLNLRAEPAPYRALVTLHGRSATLGRFVVINRSPLRAVCEYNRWRRRSPDSHCSSLPTPTQLPTSPAEESTLAAGHPRGPALTPARTAVTPASTARPCTTGRGPTAKRGRNEEGCRGTGVNDVPRHDTAPPAGFEPALPPPEGGALSPELRGPIRCAPFVRAGRG